MTIRKKAIISGADAPRSNGSFAFWKSKMCSCFIVARLCLARAPFGKPPPFCPSEMGKKTPPRRGNNGASHKKPSCFIVARLCLARAPFGKPPRPRSGHPFLSPMATSKRGIPSAKPTGKLTTASQSQAGRLPSAITIY